MSDVMRTEELVVEMADCGANALVTSYDETVCGGPVGS
jgi:hypothetical protein